jgi:hypothetical protein
MSDILDRIRNTTVDDLANVRADFDDLPRGHFRAAKNTGMTRIVEGADDLVSPFAGRGNGGGGSTRPTPAIPVDLHPDGTCDNPKCCTTAGPVDARSEAQIRFMASLIDQLANLDAKLAEDAAAYTTGMTLNGRWTRNQGQVKGTISVWIDRLKAKIAELKAAGVAPAPVAAKSDTWATWRELAAKLVEIGGQHGARFAVDTEDGAVNELAFWWIVKNTNPETGHVRYFIRQVIGGQGAVRVRMSPEAMISIARKIEAAGPVEAMLRYGQEIGECGHCGRELTNDTSRAVGMGPKCRKGKGM